MFTASGSSHRRRNFANKHGMNRTSGHNDPSKDREEDVVSRLESNYGNKLLSLRAALNEKELQLVELREQHISVVNRAAIARQNWEDALKSKDQVIVQLQKALHVKKCELDRQERVNEENVQRLLQQREEEENTELEQKERKISHLEAKNTQFVQEVVDQQKSIVNLKKQFEDKDRHCASHLHKIEVITGRVKDLKAALQKKEEILETQRKYCQELKTLLWKRDSFIGQLQLAEQQLQSCLARQEADYEALQCAKQKLEDERDVAEKHLTELRLMIDNRDAGSLHNKCEKNLKEKESCLRRQRRQIQELERCLESTEEAVDAKRKEHQQFLYENQRLVEKYDSLKQDFEESQQRKRQLESELESVQKRLIKAERVIFEAEEAAMAEAAQYSPSPERSISADTTGEDLMDDILEFERESNVGQVHDGVTFPRKQKQPYKTPVPFEASRLSAAPSTRNPSSSAQRAKDGCKMQSARNPLVSDVLDAFVSKNPLSVDHAQRPPKSRTYQGRAQATKTLYDPVSESTKKAERKAWSLVDTTQINPTETMVNGRLTGNAVAVSESESQSSESSQPYSPSKQDMGSCSDMDRVATEERSPTLVEAFQNSSIATQKKTPTYLYTSRKRTSSHLQGSPCLTDDSQTPTPTDRRSAISVTANESEGIQALPNGWTVQECSFHEAHRSPREGEIASCNGNKKRPLAAPSVENVDGEMNYSQIQRDRKGRSVRQDINGSTKVSGAGRNISRDHGTGKLPPTTKTQVPKKWRNEDSLRPSTPPSDHFQESSETALKSLQEEVMKRERGWRRTEANMRAALCRRLAELNGTDQSRKGEEMVEMVERARSESKRPFQRGRT